MQFTPTPENFIQLAIGLALFAFGWFIFRIGIKAVGFGLGFMAGYSSYNLLLEWLPKIFPDFMRYLPTHPLTAVFVGIVIGLVGMFLAKRMYMAVIFIGALAGGLYLFYATGPNGVNEQRMMVENFMKMVGIYESIDRTLGDLWLAILALIIAGLFVAMQKQVIILATACVGSYIIVETIHVPILFLPLCFVGFLLQQSQSRYKRKKKYEVEE